MKFGINPPDKFGINPPALVALAAAFPATAASTRGLYCWVCHCTNRSLIQVALPLSEYAFLTTSVIMSSLACLFASALVILEYPMGSKYISFKSCEILVFSSKSQIALGSPPNPTDEAFDPSLTAASNIEPSVDGVAMLLILVVAALYTSATNCVAFTSSPNKELYIFCETAAVALAI